VGQEIEISVNPLDPLETDLTYSFNIGTHKFDTFGIMETCFRYFGLSFLPSVRCLQLCWFLRS